MLGVGSLDAGGFWETVLYYGVGAVYGDHAAVRVAFPVFVAVYALPGVALFSSAVVGGLVFVCGSSATSPS